METPNKISICAIVKGVYALKTRCRHSWPVTVCDQRTYRIPACTEWIHEGEVQQRELLRTPSTRDRHLTGLGYTEWSCAAATSGTDWGENQEEGTESEKLTGTHWCSEHRQIAFGDGLVFWCVTDGGVQSGIYFYCVLAAWQWCCSE